MDQPELGRGPGQPRQRGDPAITPDGPFVVFESWASNLVPEGGNGERDVFVVDLVTLAVERGSVSSTGSEGGNASYYPALDGDGHRVVFTSTAWNLVPGDTNAQSDILLRDRGAARTDLASRGPHGVLGDGPSTAAAFSADGRWVAFESMATNLVPGDSNGCTDIFVVGPLLDEIFDDGFESGDTTGWAVARVEVG